MEKRKQRWAASSAFRPVKCHFLSESENGGMLITDEYRRLNTDLHQRYPGYGSKGKLWAPRVVELARKVGAQSVLDWGCGKGSLGRALDGSGLDVREYDPAVPGKDAAPDPADLVVCTDVLEHVEPGCLDAVIAHIASLAIKAALVAVACRPGKRELLDGRPDHLIVEPPEWWRKRLARIAPFQAIPARRTKEYAAVLIK